MREPDYDEEGYNHQDAIGAAEARYDAMREDKMIEDYERTKSHKGFEVRLTRDKNFKAYSTKLFLKRKDAVTYVKNHKDKQAYYRIIPVDAIHHCRTCKKLHVGDICERCEELRDDETFEEN